MVKLPPNDITDFMLAPVTPEVTSSKLFLVAPVIGELKPTLNLIRDKLLGLVSVSNRLMYNMDTVEGILAVPAITIGNILVAPAA
jgi:hypothetical protein